jgi:hypothetical protein
MGTKALEKAFGTGSTFLFPTPRILYGVARLLDLGALLDSYNVSQMPAEADALALYSDWRMVGRDLQYALEHSSLNSDDIRMAIR